MKYLKQLWNWVKSLFSVKITTNVTTENQTTNAQACINVLMNWDGVSDNELVNLLLEFGNSVIQNRTENINNLSKNARQFTNIINKMTLTSKEEVFRFIESQQKEIN